jgi:N-acetylmuramoyl-L-alanine amidase
VDTLTDIARTLGVGGSITTTLGLAGLLVAATYLLARQWLNGQQTRVDDAIKRGDNDMLSKVLDQLDVPLEGLTKDQKFQLANAQLRQRWIARLVTMGLISLGIVALVAVILVLALRNRPSSPAPVATSPPVGDRPAAPARTEVDTIALISLLSHFPPEEREEQCLKVLPAAQCIQLRELWQQVNYVPASGQQVASLRSALTARNPTAAQVRELTACGGDYSFAIRENLLGCANGQSIPFINLSTGRTLSPPFALIIHSSQNAFSAAGEVSAMQAERVSVHLIVGRNGAIVQAVPFNQVAGQVGRATWRGLTDLNARTLSIEFIANQGQTYTDEQIAVARVLAPLLVRQYGLTQILGHGELERASHTDPGPEFPMALIRQAAGLPPQPAPPGRLPVTRIPPGALTERVVR